MKISLKYKYPFGHRFHRSEANIAKDLKLVLSTPFTFKTKHGFIKSIIWGWSERFGKYEGCRCSLVAQRHYRMHRSKDLRHDHAIPKNIIIKKLLKDGSSLPISKLLRLMGRFCEAVVITRKEDSKLNKAGLRQKMPKGWTWGDPLARYKRVGIKISKIRLKKQPDENHPLLLQNKP